MMSAAACRTLIGGSSKACGRWLVIVKRHPPSRSSSQLPVEPADFRSRP